MLCRRAMWRQQHRGCRDMQQCRRKHQKQCRVSQQVRDGRIRSRSETTHKTAQIVSQMQTDEAQLRAAQCYRGCTESYSGCAGTMPFAARIRASRSWRTAPASHAASGCWSNKNSGCASGKLPVGSVVGVWQAGDATSCGSCVAASHSPVAATEALARSGCLRVAPGADTSRLPPAGCRAPRAMDCSANTLLACTDGDVVNRQGRGGAVALAQAAIIKMCGIEGQQPRADGDICGGRCRGDRWAGRQAEQFARSRCKQ